MTVVWAGRVGDAVTHTHACTRTRTQEVWWVGRKRTPHAPEGRDRAPCGRFFFLVARALRQVLTRLLLRLAPLVCSVVTGPAWVKDIVTGAAPAPALCEMGAALHDSLCNEL